MYSTEHVSSFGAPHLKGGAWYLDCRPGFMPPREEALFSSLFSIAPVEAVPEEEETAQPAQVVKPKVRGKKAKDGAASEPTAQSTALVVTHSTTKAATEASATPVSTAIGSPSALPSMVLAVAS